MSPLFGQLLDAALPQATLVDGAGPLHAARLIKTDDEIMCIRTGIAIAEAALSATIARLRPGIAERSLQATFHERMASLGVTSAAMAGTFCSTPLASVGGRYTLRQVTSDQAIDEGDLVALNVGVLYAGYEGGLARTWPCVTSGRPRPEKRVLYDRWNALWQAIVGVCRPGRTAADLRKAYEASGEPAPSLPLAYGVGLGVERPVVGPRPDNLDGDWQLTPGMVLAVQGYMWERGTGGFLGRETVLITEDGPEVLTKFSHGPLAAE
jgi:Xaa-Pro aminopeptidase